MRVKVKNTECKYALNTLDGSCFCVNQEEYSVLGIKFMKCKHLLCENNEKCDYKSIIKMELTK